MKLSCTSCGLEREATHAEAMAGAELRCARCGHALAPPSSRPQDVDTSDVDVTTLYVKESAEPQLVQPLPSAPPTPPAPSVDPFGATLVGPAPGSPEATHPPGGVHAPRPAAGAPVAQYWQPPPAQIAEPVQERGSTALSIIGLGLLFLTVATAVGVVTYFLFRTDLLR